MKIARLRIQEFQQFQDLSLDFTDPLSGRPMDAVCLIGPNGTGKTTLLKLLGDFLLQIDNDKASRARNRLDEHRGRITCECWTETGPVIACGAPWSPHLLFRSTPATLEALEHFPSGPPPETLPPAERAALALRNPQTDRLVHVPTDTGELAGGPQSSLNDALAFFKSYPTFHEVSTRTANEFWRHLIYQVKRRENDWQEYLRLPQNRDRTVAQVEADFESTHPDILRSLATLWNRILAPAGLTFDMDGVKKPVQLNDNLEAWIRVKRSGTRVEYPALSSGMRSFLFRVGHIHALFFQADIQRAFLLLDEPEQSLHPDFLYDIIQIYKDAAPGAQLFVATHNPIIAAAFPPEARIVLGFDSHGAVAARRGITPEGDDPNDLLKKDFEVRSLYGARGLQMWERYMELGRRMDEDPDPETRRAAAREYLAIGMAYGFGEHQG